MATREVVQAYSYKDEEASLLEDSSQLVELSEGLLRVSNHP
jgi:hypothetical protein